jgi:hypothetical protein
MNKASLLGKLSIATDKAASLVIQRGLPVTINKKSTIIGSTVVEKNDNGSYNVVSFDKKVLFENISVFDVAVIIAQRYNQQEHGVIKQVLYLEERFSKYHTDMIYYLHCMKSAKKKKDLDRFLILEDKFQVAEQYAKNTRDSISIFKRVK